MSDVVRNVSSVMRGAGEGRVLVRDYAAGDLAQARFAVKEGQRLGDNFYVRGDGTRAYYFTPAALKGIFRRDRDRFPRTTTAFATCASILKDGL
jgi:hypothetical protein